MRGESRFQEGNQLLVARRYPEAIAAFMAHARAVPNEAGDALARAAESYKRMTLKGPVRLEIAPDVFAEVRDCGEAAKLTLQEALRTEPNHLECLIKYSQFLKPGTDEFFAVLQRICSQQENYMSLIAMGDELRKRKRLEEAYASYERAQKSEPKDETAYRRLNDICHKLGRSEEAKTWTERWHAAYQTKRNVGRR